jgi:hypothetical protein
VKEDVTIINLSNIKEGHLDKMINESAKFYGNSEVLNQSIKKSMHHGGSTFGKSPHIFKDTRMSSHNQTSIVVQQSSIRVS